MNTIRTISLFLATLLAAGHAPGHVAAAPPEMPIPVAILPFESRGDVDREAAQVADLLFAKLIVSGNMMLVERAAIDSVFEELKLNQSGVVKTDEATQVGKLTGAKLLITGSVLEIGGDLYVVAKVIGTETSRLAGASVKGPLDSDLGKLVQKLGAEIEKVVATRRDTLLPAKVDDEDWVAKMKPSLKGKDLPSVAVALSERHVGQQTFDPAARTELERLLVEIGFNVIAADSPNVGRADVLIKGEAFSQTASTRDGLVSVKCRVEAQATRQTDDRVLAADAETTISIDLAEQIAGKSGLQEAARELLGRLLPKLR